MLRYEIVQTRSLELKHSQPQIVEPPNNPLEAVGQQ